MRNLFATAVAALGLFVLSACGDSSASSPVGTYTLDKAAFKQQMVAQMPADTKPEDKKRVEDMFDKTDGKLELKADNTATFSIKMPNPMGGEGMNESHSGTWKLDGNTISLTMKDATGKDETKTGTYAAGVITVQEESEGQKVTMTFKK